MLTPAEQRLFTSLSVFVGGFSLAGAEAIAGAGEAAEADVLDGLQSLLDKSLIRRSEDGGGEPRYRMLETIREYGLERLKASGEADVREWHAHFYLALAEQAEAELKGERQALWLARLENEYDNLRAALRWSQDHGMGEMTLRFIGALWRFWWVRGYLSESVGWIRAALAATDRPTADYQRLRARALNGAGNLAWAQSDFVTARVCHETALAIWQALADDRGLATSLGNLGIVAKAQGDYPTARAFHERSLALSRRLDDRLSVAFSLNNLALVADLQGDYDTARVLFEESLALRRALSDERGVATIVGNLGFLAYHQGDMQQARLLIEESLALQRRLGARLGIANALNDMGNVAHCDGRWATARDLYQESLAIRREIDDHVGCAKSLHDLGQLALDEGDYDQARRLLIESLALRRQMANRQDIADSLLSLAELAVRVGDAERAARLLGAAEALRDGLGAVIHRVARARYDAYQALARAALGESAFYEVWAAGRTLTLEAALVVALA